MKINLFYIVRVCVSGSVFYFAPILAGLLCLPQSGLAQTNLLRYTFDEATSGTTAAIDISGNSPAANGTFTGTGTRTTATPGNYPVAALDTGISGGYVDGGNISKLNGLQKFTLTGWINLQAAPLNGNSFMGKINNTANAGFGFLYATANGGGIAANNFALRIRVNAAGISASVNSSADNTWLFVAVTYDGNSASSNVKFYTGTTTSAATQLGTTVTLNQGTAATTTDAFQVGRNTSASGPKSYIDDVRVYNDVLPLADVEAVRRANVPPTASLWWDRNKDTNGAGGIIPNGVWGGSGILVNQNNWSSSSTGDLGTQQWTEGKAANFAAGTDATGSYTITVSNAPTASAINIEEGTVLFNNSSVILTAAGGAIDVVSGASATFDSTTISGTVGLTKTGSGTLALGQANSFSGNTVVSAGALKVFNSSGSATGTGTVTVNSNATLTGAGTISGTVALSGTISPGTSPGTITTGAETWSGGGTYFWEVNNSTNDAINATSLVVSSTSVSRFTLGLNALASLAGWGANTATNWTIVHTTGGITGFTNADQFNITNNFAAAGNALANSNYFAVATVSNDLVLKYNLLAAVGDSLVRSNGAAAQVAASTLLSNDNGTGLSVTSFSAASANGGQIEFGGGIIYYNPPTNNYNISSDTFTYTVTDTNSHTAVGTVTVTISGGVEAHELGMQAAGLVTFNGLPNTSYKIQYTDDLTPIIVWHDLTTVSTDANGKATYQDPGSLPPARYYRVIVP